VRPAIWLWCARIAWAVLPATTGTAFSDTFSEWSGASRIVATIACWLTWSIGLFGLFAPRPWATTALRVIAPLGVVATIATAWSTDAAVAALAIATSVLAAALALSAPVAAAAGNALAYGHEQRFPLRIPTPLLFGPVPLAIAGAGVGTLGGPLLLAAGNSVLGMVVLVFGLPLAGILIRSLHSLSLRWLVLVPAGCTVVDPLTLTEPVLMRREHITHLQRVPGANLPEGVLDLRLGTVGGGVEVALNQPIAFGHRRGRTDGEIVETAALAVAVTGASQFLARASASRITTR
jgi:hypothetical protein